MKLNFIAILFLFSLRQNLQAQESSLTKLEPTFTNLKKQADAYFDIGKYELAKVWYDSCKRFEGHEFDDYLIGQIETSSRCVGYLSAIEEICKDNIASKPCLGLYEKILDINPKDSKAKKATIEAYWQVANQNYQNWDYEKAKTTFQKLTDFSENSYTTKARTLIDSCNYFTQRLENGFAAAEVDFVANYVEGIKGINTVILSNMEYPEIAIEKKVSGKVWVSFVISENGKVIPESVKAVKGIGGGCDEEAIRLVKMMKKWNPAIKKGHPVKFQYVLPIQFAAK
jgi:TonB family protein